MTKSTKRPLTPVDGNSREDPRGRTKVLKMDVGDSTDTYERLCSFLKIGADLQTSVVGEHGSNEVVFVDPTNHQNEEEIENLFKRLAAHYGKDMKVEEKQYGLTFYPIAHGPFDEFVTSAQSTRKVLVPRQFVGVETRDAIRDEFGSSERMERPMLDVAKWSGAGKRAIHVRTSMEMAAHGKTHSHGNDSDSPRVKALSERIAKNEAERELGSIIHEFKRTKQDLDHEILGAHLLEAWREESIAQGFACGYKELKVKELKELCRIRGLDDGGLKGDLAGKLMESDVELHDSYPANKAKSHHCQICENPDIRKGVEKAREAADS